jgi:hypothetical protein
MPTPALIRGIPLLVRPGCSATFIGHLPEDCRSQVPAASIFHKHRRDISLYQGRRPEHRQLLDLVLITNLDWNLSSTELCEECHWHLYFSRHFQSGQSKSMSSAHSAHARRETSSHSDHGYPQSCRINKTTTQEHILKREQTPGHAARYTETAATVPVSGALDPVSRC